MLIEPILLTLIEIQCHKWNLVLADWTKRNTVVLLIRDESKKNNTIAFWHLTLFMAKYVKKSHSTKTGYRRHFLQVNLKKYTFLKTWFLLFQSNKNLWILQSVNNSQTLPWLENAFPFSRYSCPSGKTIDQIFLRNWIYCNMPKFSYRMQH